MNSNLLDRAGVYGGQLDVAYGRAGLRGSAVGVGWLLVPFAMATVLHPSDVIWLQYKLQGQPPPHFYTAQQMAVGFIEALFALGVLVMAQLVGMVLFYRRAQLNFEPVATPALWPLAAIVAGFFGNAAWLVGTWHFDVGGCLVGLFSAAVTVGGERLCERLGRDFVMGAALSGEHP